MSNTSRGPGWWLASDGKWYPPEAVPGGPPPGYGQPYGQHWPPGYHEGSPPYGAGPPHWQAGYAWNYPRGQGRQPQRRTQCSGSFWRPGGNDSSRPS